MAKCGHVLEGFKTAEAWDYPECALCMLLLLKDLISKYSRGAALGCAVGIEVYRLELIEIVGAIWRFNWSIAPTPFDMIEPHKPCLSDSGDGLVQHLTDAVTHGIGILEDSVIPMAIARAGARVRYRHMRFLTRANDNLLKQTINTAALQETDEQLKQRAKQLRNIVATNPSRRLFEWLPVI